MNKIIVFRNTRKDFVFTADYIQVIVEELVQRGHEVRAYDPKRRRIMDFSTRKCQTIFSMSSRLEIPLIYVPLNFLALLVFALKNKRKFDYAIYMYCRLEYVVLARFLYKMAPINYILIFGNNFKKAIKIIKLFPFFYKKSDLILVPSEKHRDNFVLFMEDLIRKPLIHKTKHFPLPIPTLDILKMLSEENIQRVYRKHNIPNFHKVLFLGTKASANEQHLKIIENLYHLEQNNIISTAEITLIFPLTFSASSCYEGEKEQIISYAKQKLKKYNCVFLTSYLPAEEYLTLLKGSDIFVNMRKTDQLAASVIEALYSECIVINGKWLPYLTFNKKNNLEVIEVNDVLELAAVLEKILVQFESYKQKFKANSKKIDQIINNKDCINRYCEIFQ